MGGWGQADVKAVARLFLIVFQEVCCWWQCSCGHVALDQSQNCIIS